MATNTPLENTLERIGKKLFNTRVEAGENLELVAHSIGRSHGLISQVEHGRYKSLSFQMLDKIAAHFNIKLDDLLAP